MASDKRLHRAWAMYDWANSAYNLVITSTIFPAYYESVTGDDKDATVDSVTLLGHKFINTALYNYALAVAFCIVALMSPLLSSIADSRGNKKSFLRFFAVMGSLACSGLYFFDSSNLGLGLGLTIIACVGFWGSLVFYNSYLPDIASFDERDKVSAQGFAYGYIGSILLQIICFVFVLKNDAFGITKGYASQLSFALTGIWWLGFSIIPLSRLPKGRKPVEGASRKLSQGYAELRKVWGQMQHLPVLKRYLLSFFFYNMGVQTVMLAATLYGKSELGIPTENLIIAILIIQFIAIPGAWVISKASAALGNIQALLICVAVWIGICIAGYMLPAHNPNAFYMLATVVGFVMGGVQSLSRSTYSKLMPETRDTTSFFSFYDVTEKIAIVIGMFSFGAIQEATGSQRSSVLALTVFFAIGFALLLWTRQLQRKELQAAPAGTRSLHPQGVNQNELV
jgi:UMF1 family MFS transporter